MTITLYVIEGLASHKRYIGITNDLSRRLAEHRSGRTKAGQIVGEFRLIHTERYPDYVSARIRERFLKSGQGREWLRSSLPGPASGG